MLVGLEAVAFEALRRAGSAGAGIHQRELGALIHAERPKASARGNRTLFSL